MVIRSAIGFWLLAAGKKCIVLRITLFPEASSQPPAAVFMLNIRTAAHRAFVFNTVKQMRLDSNIDRLPRVPLRFARGHEHWTPTGVALTW